MELGTEVYIWALPRISGGNMKVLQILAAAIIAVALLAAPAYAMVARAMVGGGQGVHGEFEHTVHIETPSGKTIEVNVSNDMIVEDNTMIHVHEVQVIVEGNKIILRGHYTECEMNVTPEQIREQIRVRERAQIREMNITEMAVYDKECNCVRTKPVIRVRVEKRARLLGIIPMDVQYDVAVDPETGEIVYRPWWLVFFVG